MKVPGNASTTRFYMRRSRRDNSPAKQKHLAGLSAALEVARLIDSNIGRALVDWFLIEWSDNVIEVA